MYVDDLVSGSNTKEEAEVIKQKFIEFFRKGGFNLHKWHSSMKVNLLMPNKDLKRQPILKQYSEYPGLKIVTICLLV